MFQQDPNEVEKQSGSLHKVINHKRWPGLAVDWNRMFFTVVRHGFASLFRMQSDSAFYNQLGEIRYPFDLFCLLTKQSTNSPMALAEHAALQAAPQPEPIVYPTVLGIVSATAFDLACRTMKLDRVLELHGVPFERRDGGMITFEIAPQGLRRQYATHPGHETFGQNGISQQKLNSYGLWRLLNDREPSNTNEDRNDFIEFVRQHSDPETAAKLEAEGKAVEAWGTVATTGANTWPQLR
jgi:hypothetical protein